MPLYLDLGLHMHSLEVGHPLQGPGGPGLLGPGQVQGVEPQLGQIVVHQ